MAPSLPLRGVTLGLAAHLFRPRFRRRQIYSRSSRPGEPDCDRLFRGARGVFTLADMLHLFTHEFSGLRGRGFALTGVLLRTFRGLFLRHFHLSRR